MTSIVPIEKAAEGQLEVSDGITLWYRVWGNPAGTPVLFVHGGPGQCVADYDNINGKFFDDTQYRVVEVDQRGTGLSKPSVRDGYEHMQNYMDISIEQMAADFELIRESLGIDRWYESLAERLDLILHCQSSRVRRVTRAAAAAAPQLPLLRSRCCSAAAAAPQLTVRASIP